MDLWYLCIRHSSAPGTIGAFTCAQFKTPEEADAVYKAHVDRNVFSTLIPVSKWIPQSFHHMALQKILAEMIEVNIQETYKHK
jgi:hypothetical protein